MPNLIIIGGPNGAGKTTFARPYVRELGYDFLNADDLAKTFEDAGEAQPLLKAGRLFFRRLEAWLSEGRSFVVESTLSGSYLNKVAQRAKAAGYQVRLIFVYVDGPDVCVARVRSRVRKGGHTVPEADIRRRFGRSLGNFWTNVTELVDQWILYHNGTDGFQLVATYHAATMTIESPNLFATFQSVKDQHDNA